MKKVLLILFLALTQTSQTEAIVEKDYDSPISFQVEMLPWNEVNEILPRYAYFTVIDVETKKSFKVQRRAGMYHADVQPLTTDDTKIMKEIFNGKWSWKRRAILILDEDRLLAASMHGMPHGAGALANNFPGHFCIHFFGSITHSSNKMDLSHLLMTLKAAGKLDEYLTGLTPSETVKAFIASIEQQDLYLFNFMSLQKITEMNDKQFYDIKAIRLQELHIDSDQNPLRGGVNIPVTLSVLTESGERKVSMNILLVRTSPLESWRVDSKKFFKKLN
ncbi:hypothetical protein [Peribacillus acanthi]|uniref:hypothetical protein n=1 Tax=Peribacillus acanthi TaxID=2171554 RepID=UPI000D3E7E18|nr:hypothetical protein [Peribacillus acanthi]